MPAGKTASMNMLSSNTIFSPAVDRKALKASELGMLGQPALQTRTLVFLIGGKAVGGVFVPATAKGGLNEISEIVRGQRLGLHGGGRIVADADEAAIVGGLRRGGLQLKALDVLWQDGDALGHHPCIGIEPGQEAARILIESAEQMNPARIIVADMQEPHWPLLLAISWARSCFAVKPSKPPPLITETPNGSAG